MNQITPEQLFQIIGELVAENRALRMEIIVSHIGYKSKSGLVEGNQGYLGAIVYPVYRWYRRDYHEFSTI